MGGSSVSPLVAVGSFDGKVRLLSARSWQMAFALPMCHPVQMDATLTHVHSTLHTHTLTQLGLREMSNTESNPTAGWGHIWVETIGGEDEDLDSVPGPSGHAGPAIGLSAAGGSTRSAGRSTASHNKFGGSFSALAAHSMKSARCVNRAPSVFVTRNTLKMLPRVQPDPRSARMPPAMGVHWAAFCPVGGQYLACREESQQRCLWIWSMHDVKLCSLIVLQDNIVSSAWRPQPDSSDDRSSSSSSAAVPLLAFCTGTSRIYFWTPNENNQISCVDVPAPTATSSSTTGPSGSVASMLITSLSWTPNGRTLVLASRESFLTCDISLGGEDEEEGQEQGVVINNISEQAVPTTVFDGLKPSRGADSAASAVDDENIMHNS
jgi:WD40 repeat protein